VVSYMESPLELDAILICYHAIMWFACGSRATGTVRFHVTECDCMVALFGSLNVAESGFGIDMLVFHIAEDIRVLKTVVSV